MDALTDILRAIHLQGSVHFRTELAAPWGMAIPASEAAQFHVLRRGRCWLTMNATAPAGPLRLDAGDVVLLPRGHAHALADDPATRHEPLQELLQRHHPEEHPGPLRLGGDGEPATLICGYFTFAPGAVHPLLSVLPPLIVVRGEGGRARSWLESTLDLIADETVAGRPGGETLVDRLTEALFIQVLRSHLAEQPGDGAPSWLAGLRDPKVAAALGCIHRQPGHHWTVDDLARSAGMSRSAFSARFRELVGEPPLAYLTRWRMHLAAGHLQKTALTMPEIAERVGYQAEASFSKVFKKMWGVAPATYRREAAPAR
jgi:AraC-like DNA-binding protein